MAYITGERPSEDAGEGCPFCAAPGKDDQDGLVVHRGEHCYVVMNLFPYNPGHVLVCPYRHVSLYVDLTDEETTRVHRADQGRPSPPSTRRRPRTATTSG